MTDHAQQPNGKSPTSQLDIDEEKEKALQNIQNIMKEQSVINEKLQRCMDFQDGKYGVVEHMYTENNAKEELVLEHVIQYKKQFQLVYDESRELFLYPKNECDVYKFICTTIRPTKLGYLEFYEYSECARYVSQFVSYEELDPPDKFPKVIPSPANVIDWQKGDCFDISILLVSLLVGVGYDAYCVYGIAPREITQKNESLMDCPFIDKGRLEQAKAEEDPYEVFTAENEFAIKKKEKLYSHFDKRLEEEERAKEERMRKLALNIDDDEPDQMGDDEYAGRRLHCWVMVKKGKRGVDENLFIEPSTGRIYPVGSNAQPYIAVDAVFNHKNFWINLKADFPIHEIHFDEMSNIIELDNKEKDKEQQDETKQNSERSHENNQNAKQKMKDEGYINWEYVMLDVEQDTAKDGEQDGDTQNQYNDQDAKEKAEMGELDMPPSWSPKIELEKEKFLKESPLGEKTVFYKRCRVDTYAQYGQADGLIQRMILYSDYKRLKVIEIRQFYANRGDKLQLKRRFPFEFKIIEDYGAGTPGNKYQWKQVIEVDQRLRVIKYYHNRNHDGLVEREERIGEKTIEKYENRDDRVIYRSIRFEKKDKKEQRDITFPDTHLKEVVLTKMTQKFSQNLMLKGKEQMDKMIVDLIKNKVIVIFHLNEGEIAPKIKEYPRESAFLQKVSDSGADKGADDPITQQENYKIQQMEKEFYQNIKTQEFNSENENKYMRDNEFELEKGLHVKAREKSKLAKNQKDEEMNKEKQEADYLFPFLEKRNLLGKEKLTKQEAQDIKNEVMKKLRDRLLSRVDIIQKRLTEEKHKLEQEQNRLSKKGDHKDDEANNQIIADLTFRIGILDERASRFELMAYTKYEEMDRKLNEDPRLESLHKK